jgi:hypothetical protein
MMLSNTSGRRFDVRIRGARTAFAVPPPYTTEGFLQTFSPAQRRSLYGALAAAAVPGVEPVSTRRPPSDVVVLRTLARLTEARLLQFEPAGASGGNGQVRGSSEATGPATAGTAPPPPPPRPPPRTEVECELMAATAACSHNGRQASRAGLLEVVPGRGGDRIKLHADLRGGCGRHARWEITAPGANEVKTGQDASFIANGWAFKLLWGVFEVQPKPYHVTALACSGAMRRFEVKAYPVDQWKVTAEVDFKKNPLQWKWDVTLTTWEDLGGDDEGLKVKNALRDALRDKKTQIEYAIDKVFTPLVGPTTKWEFFTTKLIFQGKWAEHTDHRAFYKYEATLKLDPLIKGEFQIPFGPTAAIPPWIKRWTTDLVGDFYLYLKFTGELSLSGKWGRSDPDTHTASVEGEGKVGVKVGGNLFLMKRGALNLDVNGGTFISLSAKAPVARKPAVEYDLKWGGIEVELTIEAAWGMVEYKRKWRPVDGGSFFGQPKVWYPLGQ